jgi:hypothetical protein
MPSHQSRSWQKKGGDEEEAEKRLVKKLHILALPRIKHQYVVVKRKKA